MGYANVGSVQIGGPYRTRGRVSDTPSRHAIFNCRPETPEDEPACAAKILSRLVRLAWRRPVTGQDVKSLMEFFSAGRRHGGSFDAGIQFALERMLVDPEFLLRIHKPPA